MGSMKDLLGDFYSPSQPPRAAEIARDEGIAQVKKSNADWISDAIYRIKRLHDWRGIAEDLRHQLLADGLPVPTHPNAWGALIRQARSLDLLHPTGQWLSPKDVASHSRPTQEYYRP